MQKAQLYNITHLLYHLQRSSVPLIIVFKQALLLGFLCTFLVTEIQQDLKIGPVARKLIKTAVING